ncbi:MAG: hypothetical protein AB1728_09190 [Bacteroidota bacterium]
MKKFLLKLFAQVPLISVFVASLAAQQFNPVAWPLSNEWRYYTIKDTTFADPAVQDPSNGGTSPQNYVNISSGSPDQSEPSMYFAFKNNTLFVRFRVEADPNAYTGNNAANTDPWKAGTWIMMMDVNGDGWRDYAVYLNGDGGSPSTPIDRIQIIYSRLTNTQSIVPGTGIYLLSEIYGSQKYTSGTYNNKMKQFDGNGNLVEPQDWNNPVKDYGTSRVSPDGEGQFFIDFQIPVSALDASAYNGPVFTTSTVFTAVFTTANSNSDPFQKDYAYVGAFCPSISAPFASGDPITLDPGASIPKIVVTEVTAAYCPTVNLSTKVITSQRVLDCATVTSSVVTNSFYYWYDQNENNLPDEVGSSWTYISDGTATTLGTWTATWNTSSLPRGRYLIKVIAVDQAANSADSYLQTVQQYPNVYAVINNDCGIIPAALDKTVNKSTVQSNLPDAQRKVIYTIRVTNPQSNAITLDTLSDILPATFIYLNDTTGGTLTPTTSPAANSSGTIRWIFSPGTSLAAGSTKTLLFNALAGTTPGTYSNSVTARGSTYFTSANNVAPVTVTNAAATLSKSTSAVAGVNPNDTIRYTLTYTNTGTVQLTNVVVTDSLVQGLSNSVVVYNGGSYDSTTRKVTWNIGTVNVGASASVAVRVRVSQPYNGVNPLVNTGKLTSSDLAEPVYSSSVSNTVLGPVLSLSKSVSPTSTYPGNNVSFTILYGNVGTGVAHSVIVRDTLPANLTYINGTGNPAPNNVTTLSNPTRQVLTWNIGTIPAGSGNLNNTITFQASLVNPYPTVGENQPLINKAVILSNETSPYENNATLYVNAIPNVSLTKTSNQAVYATGDTGTFTLTLTNSGYYTATLDTLEDVLPNNFQYRWTNGGTLYSSITTLPVAGSTGTVRWLMNPSATIAPGETKTLSFRVKMPIVGVNYTNTARARGVLVSSTQSTISTTLPIGIAENEEVMVKSVDKSTVYVGDTLVYTLYYLNNSGSARSRTMKDTLSSSVNYVGSTATSGTVSNSGNVITWNPGTIANGGSATLTIRTIVNQGGIVISNKASMNNTTPVTFTNTVTTTSLLAPSITLTKNVDITSAPVGTELTYTIYYSNAPGVEPSTNTILTDTIPANLTYVVGSVTGGGSFVGSPSPRGRVVWNLGTVNANTNGTVSFKATINSGTPINSYIVNRAVLTNAEATYKTSSITDTVRAVPSFLLTKSVDKVSAGPADTISYTIFYKNVGSAGATSVSISDTIPTNTIFISASNGGAYSNGVVVWNLPNAAVNDSGQVTLTVRLPKPMVYNSVSQISNVSYISSFETTLKASAPALTNIIYPQVASVKSVDSTTANAKSIITYSMVVSNATISTATGTVLFDNIPGNTTYITNSTVVNGVAKPDTNGTSPLVYGLYLGDVTPDSSKTVVFQVRINSPIDNGTIITNSSRVYTDKLVDTIQGTSVTTTVLSYPQLTIRKSATITSNIPGDTITYSLVYGNTGTDTATTVTVTDTIPANTSFISGSITGTGAAFNTNRIVVSRAALIPDDTGNVVTFKVKVDPILSAGMTTIVNSAVIAALNASAASDSESVAIVARPDFSASSKSYVDIDGGFVSPADTLSYTIMAKNTGSSHSTSVVVTDTVPQSVTILSSTINPGGTVSGRVITFNSFTLNVGDSAALTYQVRIDSTIQHQTPATNVAVIRGDGDTAIVSSSFTPVNRPSMIMSKSANRATAKPGDTITYTISYSNIGTQPAALVTVSDTEPQHTTYIPNSTRINNVVKTDASDTDEVTLIGNTIQFNIGIVQPGQSGTITMKVKVN